MPSMTFPERVMNMSCHGMTCLLMTQHRPRFFSKAVGCDHGFESGARKDRCGVCGGVGDTCILVNSTYTKFHTGYGKNIT